jgi:hypothetical protein
MIRKEKKNTAAKTMAWVVAILMIASVFGIVLDYQMGGSERYNGVTFTRHTTGEHAGQYGAKIQGTQRYFHFFPTEVEDIDVPENALMLMRNAQGILVSFDPQNRTELSLAVIDFVRFDLGEQIPGKIGSGVVHVDPRYALPILTCENATAYAPVIMIEGRNASAIVLEGNCIKLYGSEQELIRTYDRLIYTYLGVMRPGVILSSAELNQTNNASGVGTSQSGQSVR